MATTGTITNFTTTPETRFLVGGDVYNIETEGKSYSITNPDPEILRFEVRQGDNWAPWDDSYVDRSEIQNISTGVATNWGAVIPAGTPIGIDYHLMVEANGPNGSFVNTQNSSNGWFIVGQMSNDNIAGGVATSPPFAVQMDGDHLQIVARYVLPGGNPSNSSSDLHMMTLWTDPNPIQAGVYKDINVKANVSNSGGGYLQVEIDGKQVVNYQGPLGYGQGTFWNYGVYRSTAPETAAVNYRDMTLVTGSTAVGWQGVDGTTPTQPTTPTSPTTPVNLAPTVTQASASPGTGVVDNGDTITMTLGFSEAVNVTGTPTLSLNDGATATYVGGSGTSALTFKTTVAPTDRDTPALAITGVNLPNGASIKDTSGLAANLSGAVKTFAGLQIDATPTSPTTPTQPTTPTSPTTPVNLAPTVTQASASPGTGIERNGDTITMTLGFSEAVTVTGTPTLALNDGGTATYVGGSGTSSLSFKTTVAPTDKDTSALAITGVNLPSGASIKDASGLAANLSGAVKTFTGLQIDATPTVPTTPTAPITPTTPTAPIAPTSSVTKPVLAIADNTLSVTGRGGSVDLGVKTATTDPNDRVTVNIRGLPRYETITTADGQTFRGNNITLTAAQVNSGLELHSYYPRGGQAAATLTLTASAKDPVSGAVTSAAPQSITVTNTRSAATTTTTSTQTNTVTNPPSSTSTSASLPGQAIVPQQNVDSVTSTAGAGFLANQGFERLREHMQSATSTLGTSRPQTVVTDPQSATSTNTASLANQSFALLNQYLAGNTGRVDPGQIATAASQPTGWAQQAILARSQH
ncbi:hypothetical protein CP49_22130 [Bradyrhizobium valentinum]|uniref:Uncharacterized protein n=1 Tax=Bradyrhizobium valentinum TaxID=1518501 RepID=A0A0R3LSD5_9BRAD|nr:hypothetical protein CP49_22130 [Bradyrhizobium valentinum]